MGEIAVVREPVELPFSGERPSGGCRCTASFVGLRENFLATSHDSAQQVQAMSVSGLISKSATGSSWHIPIMRSSLGCLVGASLLLSCSSKEGGPDWELSPTGAEPAPGTGASALPSSTTGVNPGVANPPGTPPAPGATTAVPSGPAPAPDFNFTGEPLYSRAVRLTNEQWAHSVRDVLRLSELPTQANSFLRPVGGFTTFLNNERVLDVSNDQRASYQLAAAEIADVVGTDAAIARVDAGTDSASFIETFGLRAYRRPLTSEEIARYQTLFQTGSEMSGDGTAFTKGAKLVIEAMIQSPHFLYRVELGPASQPLSGFEVAAKLSLWLRGTTPSDEVLQQAGSGELDTPDGIAALTETMLDEVSASETLTNMHAELFKFTRFSDLVKFTEEYDPETNVELEEASRRYFDRIFQENFGLREMFTGTKGFMGPKMAALYGLQAPAGGQMTLQDFGAERPGFFAQVPYLALLGDDVHSDAIHRGLFINYQVLCADLPKPGFAVSLPPSPEPGQSDRERMEAYTGKGTCGEQCHGNYINPIGYAFEGFDGLGRIRTTDADKPVDAVASYPFSDGTKTFNGVGELMNILVDSEEAHRCYAKNLMSYALQRDIIVEDGGAIDELASVSKSADGSLKAMVLALVKSQAFRTRADGSTL